MPEKPKLKKGKVTNIRELSVDLGTKAAKEVAAREPTGMMDTALKIIEQPFVQELIKTGIQVALGGLGQPAPPSMEKDMARHSPEKTVTPRSPDHELLFRQLNTLPAEMIAQVTPVLNILLSGDIAGAIRKIQELMQQVTG